MFRIKRQGEKKQLRAEKTRKRGRKKENTRQKGEWSYSLVWGGHTYLIILLLSQSTESKFPRGVPHTPVVLQKYRAVEGAVLVRSLPVLFMSTPHSSGKRGT
jgi:hypothetical protein